MNASARPVAAATLAVTVILFLSLPVAATPPPDPEAGRASYTRCEGCHSPSYNRTGPLHCGLLGRAAAGVEDYDYSAAMRDSKLVWNVETLDRFLASPLTMMPGTTMGFAGIPDEIERRNLIAWLATLDASSELCLDVLSNPDKE